MNHNAFYISQATVTEKPEAPKNLKDFLIHLDGVLAWRHTFSNDEFEALVGKPKIRIFMQAGLDIDLEFGPDDEMECNVEVVKDEDPDA